MAKKQSNVVRQAEALALPFAEELGLVIWDVLFVKEGPDWYLRYIIDKDGGVNINDCEALSRAVDAPLDEADFIEPAYHLEVQSPGMGRELTRPEHFEWMRGEKVIAKLYSPLNGQKEIHGILEEKQNDAIILTVENQTVTLSEQAIAQIRLDDDAFFI